MVLLLVFVALFAECCAPGSKYFVCVGVTHIDAKYNDICKHVCVQRLCACVLGSNVAGNIYIGC